MKKKFIKPEIQRITLNFQENIVASYQRLGFLWIKSQTEFSCALMETGYGEIPRVMYSDFFYGTIPNVYDIVKGAGCFAEPGSAAQFARSRGLI